jgi:hypothetical protein
MTVALLSVKSLALVVLVARASVSRPGASRARASKAWVIVSASALLPLSLAALLVGRLKARASNTFPSTVSSKMYAPPRMLRSSIGRP